ncbi:uncharacterized protein PHACADRAFT_194779 [Phanerochaete carnosa HHB-10118-sp]|uniref:CTP synthase N-terminal domain-containing protein n=1 Tax=Phanerochaete carnosa (strain HHB-10118-sp) TaxID=650164 RepID=K5W051_PHACS|nr:uncharacterized protein PHACADRAFT_194779 [Phanerochaete carnosa HHB-10118-sp]EKM57213.1 hypothetical protein PHACADRAFT_194779 [Phanerochaete carnosa HHB-10118-sp]
MGYGHSKWALETRDTSSVLAMSSWLQDRLDKHRRPPLVYGQWLCPAGPDSHITNVVGMALVDHVARSTAPAALHPLLTLRYHFRVLRPTFSDSPLALSLHGYDTERHDTLLPLLHFVLDDLATSIKALELSGANMWKLIVPHVQQTNAWATNAGGQITSRGAGNFEKRAFTRKSRCVLRFGSCFPPFSFRNTAQMKYIFVSGLASGIRKDVIASSSGLPVRTAGPKATTIERRGDYHGKTIQTVPHVTNAIEDRVNSRISASWDAFKLGGTVSDIKSAAFIKAMRQF